MTYRENNGWLKIKAMQQEIGIDAISHAFSFIDFYLDEGKTKEEIEKIFSPILFMRVKKRQEKEAKVLEGKKQ
jgi:hypothetical protein